MDRRIGAQFYTLHDHTDTAEDFDIACKRVSEMGYKTVQISGVPLEAEVIRPVLDRYGLKCVVTHLGYNLFKNDLDYVINYNRTLGCEICGLGAMPPESWQTSESLTEFIETANDVTDKLKKENLVFAYHNHAFEFVKLGGKTIYDRLVEECRCDFIVDTYWLQVGGKNSADVIRTLGRRAVAVHFKDFKVERENWQVPQMCEIGEGNLDWDGIIAACDDAGTLWALVEQDTNHIDNDPFKALKISYDYLCRKGFN